MRPRLNVQKNSAGRDQLAWLVLRIIAELTPLTPAALISLVSDQDRHSESGQLESSARRLILDAILSLEIQDLIKTDQDQIAITDQGRQYLQQRPLQSLPTATANSVPLSLHVGRLLGRCASQVSRVRRLSLMASRMALRALRMSGRQALNRLHQSAAAFRKWRSDVAPMAVLRTKPVVAAMTQLVSLQARAAVGLVRHAVTLLQTCATLPRLAHNPKLAGGVVGALCLLVLAAMHGVASLAQKPAASAEGVSVPDIFASPVETALVVLPQPAGAIDPSDLGKAAPEQASPENAGHAPPDGAAPSVIAESPPDPIVVIIRAKLADPTLHNRVPTKDLAALQFFYAELAAPVWIEGTGLSTRAQDVIEELRAADDWGLSAEAFDLPADGDVPATPEEQATDEIKLSLAALKYARFARGGRIAPARFGKLIQQRPNLEDPRTTLTELAVSSDPAAYLRSLHPPHEQFARLREALTKARAEDRESTSGDEHVVQRLIVNMERWRWMPAELGSYYVWNNIPTFSVRVMKNGGTLYTERTVVGQVKYPTPVFSAHMRSIVFNPKWVVPETIKLEDLQPRLRQRGFFGQTDLSVLRQYQLAVSYQGQPVDASSVDWDRANILQYTFTQPPGPSNMLGKLKFNFPNRYAIYMHDTLQPELFDEAVRTRSHGCIRVREPDRLAMLLLAEDKGWAEQQVQTLLATANETVVMLNRAVPVHLTYFTAVVDAQGEVQTFADVYGIDSRMAQALFGKAAVKSDAPMFEAKAATPESEFWRSVERTGAVESISGLFGN